MQRNNLTYEWNDVALLVDQRAYTLVCKTMLQIAEQNMNEIQDITLYDWVWNSEELEDKTIDCTLVPFQGTVTLQIQYLNHDFQQETFFVEVPIQGAWQEAITQQNSMRLMFHHAQLAETNLLLETVLQVGRNQPLDASQVIIGKFQMDEIITISEPWPHCDSLLATSVTLQVTDWEINSGKLFLQGSYQVVSVYQSTRQIGEQIFLHEYRMPVETVLQVPEGLKMLNGIVPYYQSMTAQVLNEQQIQMIGNGVFCTMPAIFQEKKINEENKANYPKDTIPSVVNSRGSRRANLSKYMRSLNQSVETPTSIRNFEIGTEQE